MVVGLEASLVGAVSDISVIWLNFNEGSPNHGYWCYGWLEETLANVVEGQEPHVFYWADRIDDWHTEENEGAIVVIPAEYNAKHVDKINLALAKLPWCVLVLASDEAGLFPIELLDMTNVTSLWVMTPHFEKHVYPPGTNFLPEFYPQDARERIARFKSLGFRRKHMCSFSGQITHERRYSLAEWMEAEGHYINKTPGFTQGLGRDDYYQLLVQTETTPAPSGPVTPDSFRAFEALESGGIPILDLYCPSKPVQDCSRYWDSVLGQDHPVPVGAWTPYCDQIVEDNHDNWPMSSNLVFSWWQMYKREVRYRILDSIPGIEYDPLTILIPTSPIPTHPTTLILDQTIESIRFHFPHADILVMCDGVRPEQEDRRHDYDRYVQEVCWKANFEWERVYPIVFGGHEHQANMTRAALDYVKTPLVMFVEHDTPLVTDEPFDWPGLINLAKSDDTDVIRFHFEAHVHPEHEHMMIDPDVVYLHDVPVRRTVQWSQRPHIAKTSYYQRILNDHFPSTGRTMIEDKMHSVAQQYANENHIAIYHPGVNIKRSLHTDGRGHDPKFEMVYE